MSNSISPGRFEFLPPVVKNIVIINGLCYLGTYVLKTSLGVNLIDVLGMHIPGSKAFAFWQPLTHLFMHGNLEHLLFNMFSFWMFGSILENVWGSSRFLIFYLVAGIGAAFLHYLVVFLKHYLVVFLKDIRPESLRIEDLNLNIIGASGAVAGIWIAFAFMFPNSYLYLFFFLPVKAKYLAMMYIAFELFAAFEQFAASEANPADNVAHFAHLGGMFFGFAMVRWFRRVDTNWG